jgi:hypothetical protein
MYETANGKLLAEIGEKTDKVEAFSFSPNGKEMAIKWRSKAIWFWDVETGSKPEKFSAWVPIIQNIMYSPCGNKLAFDLFLYDRKTGKPLNPVPGHSKGIASVVVSADGNTLVTGGSGGLILWDGRSGRLLRRLKEDREEVWTVQIAFACKDKILVSAEHRGHPIKATDSLIRFTDVATGKERPPIRCRGRVLALRVDPAGSLLAAIIKAVGICIWDTNTGKELLRLPESTTQENDRRTWWTNLTFSSDGRKLVACGDSMVTDEGDFFHSARIWDLKTRSSQHTMIPARDALALALTANGQTLIAIAEWDGIVFGDLSGKNRHRKIPCPWNHIASPVISPDQKLLAHETNEGGLFSRIEIREVTSGRLVTSLRGSLRTFDPIAFSRDGRRIYFVEGGNVLGWDLLTDAARLTPEVRLSKAQIAHCWGQLASADPRLAFRAMGRLGRDPREAVAGLKEFLKPVPHRDVARIRKLIANLNDDEFEVREGAIMQLASLGRFAHPELQEAFRNTKSLQVQRSAGTLLKLMTSEGSPTENLRVSRAVMLLEWLGSEEARELLQQLAKGEPLSPLSIQAREALPRLSRQRDR